MNNSSEIFTTETDFRNRYQYDENDLLGEGGFAQVYKAYDKQFQEYVALKFYSKGDQGKYDVLHEMKDTRRFSHPNIIRIHDAFVVRFDHTGGHSYVQVGILEFANGGNLRDFIRTNPSEDKFIEVLIGILHGLEYLHHDKKMIHRDLSPENILMYVEEDFWTPKIADFGISKRMGYVAEVQDKTKSTQLLGKVDYMAPEQFYPEKFGIQGKISTNVDLWAFGVILYELFQERKPFGNNSPENPLKIIQSITSDPLPDLLEIPEPYRTAIKRCLEKNANNRVSSAREVISILQKSLARKPEQLTETIAIKTVQQKSKKQFLVYIGLFVLLLVVAGYFMLTTDITSEPDTTVSVDPAKKKNEITLLIKNKQFKQAIYQIDHLPENLKSQQDFMDLYKQTIHAQKLDSVLIAGNHFFRNGNYNEALSSYNKVLNEYDPLNTAAKRRIDTINQIIKQARTLKEENLSPQAVSPKPIPDGMYRKGMFSVTRYPETKAIQMESIELTKKETIISLKLKSGESWYFSSPGKSGAFYLEYNNKQQRLDLNDITGVAKGTFVIFENDKILQLHFNRLPRDVREFNLINGDVTFHKEYKYADFIGVKL